MGSAYVSAKVGDDTVWSISSLNVGHDIPPCGLGALFYLGNSNPIYLSHYAPRSIYRRGLYRTR